MAHGDFTNKVAELSELASLANEVIGAEKANARFGELCTRAQHGGDRFLITRHGKPAAVIVPVADLEKIGALQSAA